MQDPTDDDVADWLDETDWSPRVIQNAVSNLNAWGRWLTPRGVALLDASSSDLRAYLAHRKDAGIAPATRKKEWQHIRGFYRWAATATRDGGAGLLDRDPMERIKAPHVPTRPTTRAAKPDEVAALEDHFERIARQRRAGGEAERARRNTAMISLMFRSGVRVGELPWIDLGDVHRRTNGHLAIRLRADHTKSGEDRIIPVLPETERYLKRYLRLRGDGPGPLFRGRAAHTRDPDRRLTVAAIRMIVERAAKRVGVPVSSHQFRRGFVSQYLRAAGDVLSLEVVGGWADHRMPRRYLADEEQEAAIDRFYTVGVRSAR